MINRWIARAMVVAVCLAGLTGPACAQDKVVFGLDWKAEAEYGGYYQALAMGIYAKHGLTVTIREGGPQANQAQLLLLGQLDFDITSNSFLALNFVKENIPFRAVAAMFQKDPSVLIAHPGQGNDSFAAMRGKPVMIGADTRASWWNFLRVKYGYSDTQIRPYTFDLAPFLADDKAIQQGYLGSEPYSIRETAHFDPVVLLIADAGFEGYGSLIATSDTMIRTRPDVVQRFIDASIEGWVSYLDGDPAPGNKLIRAANPEMTEALLAYGRDAMKTHGILTSGDASTFGIGAMTEARWKRFLSQVAEQGLYPADLDVSRAYTTQFVNHRVGLEPAK
jgi:NitT/TauT family transport system substrate-binding protein